MRFASPNRNERTQLLDVLGEMCDVEKESVILGHRSCEFSTDSQRPLLSAGHQRFLERSVVLQHDLMLLKDGYVFQNQLCHFLDLVVSFTQLGNCLQGHGSLIAALIDLPIIRDLRRRHCLELGVKMAQAYPNGLWT
jgi:hypothetical protein